MRTLLLPGLLVVLTLAACQTVPGTGRKQLNFLSTEEEISLGEQAYAETLGDAKLMKSGPEYQMVQRIGTRIADAARRLYPETAEQFQWEIVLIDDPQTANAWCLPGGKMAVYTGILPITQDEASLAVVVGHEVAHAVAHHGAERISQNYVFEGLLGAVSVGVGDMDAGEKDLLLQALSGAGTVGVILPFSRSHESEADQIGLYLAADAGYDPQAAIGLWERMAANAGGERPPEFMSTHPSEETRIARLKEHMPEALEYYRKAQP